MRKIGIQEIEDIALGATLLGAGGGGDPYIGKLTAIGAVKECGEVELIGIDEVPDGAFIMPAASMGAPTILAEKGAGANEFAKLFDMVSRYYGKPIYATMPIEAGGVNSMLPIAAAARLGIPMVDVDGMGRAFPELQMVTFTIGGASATPMAFIDEKGNSGILDTITNKWTEDIARAATMTMGGTLTVALFCMDVDTCKQYGVHGIVTRSEELGRAIRTAKDEAAAAGLTPEEFFLKFTGGHKLFKGKISDVLRETRGAFNFGRVVLEGIGEDGQISEDARKAVDGLLKSQFRPEFLNRLDEIVFYKPLTKAEIGGIVELQLDDLRKRLADKQLNLAVTDAAKDFIIEEGYDPIYGARPLKRFIQSRVETLIAKEIIGGVHNTGDTLTVDVENGALILR